MPDKWTVTYTDYGTPSLPGPGSDNFFNEADFIRFVRSKLDDHRAGDLSAVLPDGTKLDKKALREKYGERR